MKNKIILLLVLLIFGYGESDRERPDYYENDYGQGYENGSDDGYSLGWDKGYEQGYLDAKKGKGQINRQLHSES